MIFSNVFFTVNFCDLLRTHDLEFENCWWRAGQGSGGHGTPRSRTEEGGRAEALVLRAKPKSADGSAASQCDRGRILCHTVRRGLGLEPDCPWVGVLVLALTGCVDVNLDTVVALYPWAVNSPTSHSRGREWDSWGYILKPPLRPLENLGDQVSYELRPCLQDDQNIHTVQSTIFATQWERTENLESEKCMSILSLLKSL